MRRTTSVAFMRGSYDKGSLQERCLAESLLGQQDQDISSKVHTRAVGGPLTSPSCGAYRGAGVRQALSLSFWGRAFHASMRATSLSGTWNTVGDELCGEIGGGLMVLLGVAADDTADDARQLADKIVGLRIFNDAEGKMNLALADVGDAMLVVSQFTLLGDCRKGRRPSFVAAARRTWRGICIRRSSTP